MSRVLAVGSEPKRRLRRGSAALFVGAGVMLAVGLISIVFTTHGTKPPGQGAPTGAPAAGPTTPAPEPRVTHSVRYELTGDGALDITYVDGSTIAQVAKADTPWSATLSFAVPAHSTQFYSLTARDAGQGSLTCRLVVDGTPVAEQTVSAPGAVVRCSKTLG